MFCLILNECLELFLQQKLHSISYSCNCSAGGEVILCWDPDATHGGQLWHPNAALPYAVLVLLSGAVQETTTFSKRFSKASILTLTYYRSSPAQTGKKSFTQHIYFCSEKFPVYNWIVCMVRIMKKENEYQWYYTVYIMIIKSPPESLLLHVEHILFF